MSGRGRVTVALSSSPYYTTFTNKGKDQISGFGSFLWRVENQFKLELLGIS